MKLASPGKFGDRRLDQRADPYQALARNSGGSLRSTMAEEEARPHDVPPAVTIAQTRRGFYLGEEYHRAGGVRPVVRGH